MQNTFPNVHQRMLTKCSQFVSIFHTKTFHKTSASVIHKPTPLHKQPYPDPQVRASRLTRKESVRGAFSTTEGERVISDTTRVASRGRHRGTSRHVRGSQANINRISLTPNSHRVRQRITHSFYDIPHHVPVHVWGWNPSAIMVAHTHSV